ncbi:MAG TPA: type IV pilin protein [Candidatus Omnitrophota bacterium]|nr:type IV pilin protein [Candidatus Omnitrophota bacterium]
MTKAGFTLVEIMIVVLIIALLSAIAIPNVLRARINAHDASAQAALKTIATAMETYLSTNSVYPPNTTALIGVTPPYLQVDYFDGNPHGGFTFTVDTLNASIYSVTAAPASVNLGSGSYTITTGSVLVKN